MKKPLLLFLTVAIATAVTLAVIYARKSDPTAANPSSLTIHFTCDTSGRLEPCGCFSGQHGGLTRLKTWLDSQTPADATVKVDVGGAIAGGADYDLIQYRYLSRAYFLMGYSALNMGGAEAAIPAATLRKLASASPVPLVSASIVDADTREGFLEPYRIVNVGSRRIGILGLVSPGSVPTPGEGLGILSLNEAVDRHLPKLRESTDAIIVLAFAKETELRQLARDYFEFSVILGGDVSGPTQEIIRENDSIVLFTTNEARTVGTLTAKLSDGPRMKLLDPSYQIELLWDTIPQADEFLKLGTEYRAEIRKTPLAIDQADAVDPNAIPGVKPTATFVGSASCQSCHPKSHETWSNSGHAHAFQTLVDKGSDADPHCIQCHTVGFDQPGGYRRPMGSTSLTDVGCESCHGPASEHIDKYVHGKATNFKFRPLGPGDCKSCHHGEFSRPFEWDTFWPGISHGKEGEKPKY